MVGITLMHVEGNMSLARLIAALPADVSDDDLKQVIVEYMLVYLSLKESATCGKHS